MINRDNWLTVKAYLKYLTYVRQLDDQTIKKRRGQLNHLLIWADDKPFIKARSIDPTFPVYLLTARNDGKSESLSPESLKSTCEVARRFFTWCRINQVRKYRSLSESWVDSIRPARSRGMQTQVREHAFYTLEDMKKVAGLKLETIRQKRDQAAMCFMYLSGVRAGAFITLPVDCVDLEKRKVYQLPSHGVHTKNSKAAVTSLLAIPELMKVVKEWDRLVRTEAPAGAAWYAHLNTRGEFASLPKDEIAEGREKILARGMKEICKLAGITYLSSHKERHGHVVFAMQRVQDMAGLKAISQNIMHSSVAITDGVYGNMTGDQVQEIIESLGTENDGDMDLKGEIRQLLEILKEKRGE